jgi:hypothetical protein
MGATALATVTLRAWAKCTTTYRGGTRGLALMDILIWIRASIEVSLTSLMPQVEVSPFCSEICRIVQVGRREICWTVSEASISHSTAFHELVFQHLFRFPGCNCSWISLPLECWLKCNAQPTCVI